MTTSLVMARGRPGSVVNAAACAIAAIGCGALAARPALVASAPHPTAMLVVLFGVLLTVGLAIPISHAGGSGARVTRSFGMPLLVGLLAFGAGRLIVGGHAPGRLTLAAVLANTLAAVAEEVWFRRFCYGLLAPAGPVLAVGASTVLFAAVHVSTYGFWILPLDLAAGALFGWQRMVTGSCALPAVTHAVANVLVLL